jgi:hypothetical protein
MFERLPLLSHGTPRQQGAYPFGMATDEFDIG